MKPRFLPLLLVLGLLVPGPAVLAQSAQSAQAAQAAQAAPPSSPPSLTNADFETGEPGTAPPGWAVTEGAARRGYTGRTIEEKPAAGKRAAVLESAAGISPYEAAGALRQTIDATALRGKRVRLSGITRVEGTSAEMPATASLRIGIERAGGTRADAVSESVTASGWSPLQVLAEIPADATLLRFDLYLAGPGKGYFDGVTLAVVGLAGEGNEPARALSPRGLDNLAAFTRLLGYVRFFHPSDQAAAADWPLVARTGVERVEKAANPKELARALEEVFRPLAPTLRVVAGKKRPQLPPELSAKDPGASYVAWDHKGVALSQRPNLYSSKRVTLPHPQTQTPAAPAKKEGEAAGPVFPKPGEPLFANLGGGVWAFVPMALYKDATGTLPRPVEGAALPASGKPDGFVPTGNDRVTRLADIALAWNVFQHFYPYFDVVRADWPAELRQALSTAATDTDETAFLTTLQRMVAALEDGHGGVYHPAHRYNYSIPLLWTVIDGKLVVRKVAPTGAEGVRLGDVVLRIDGRPASEILAERRALTSGAPQWTLWRASDELLSGPQGEKVELEVEHVGGERATVTLTRSVEHIPFLARDKPEKIAEIRPGLFYVDLDRVTDADFNAAVERLATARGVIFDLRGYPAEISTVVLDHLTDKPITCARWLVPRVTFPDRQGMGFDFSNWTVKPKEPRLKGKIAFLTNAQAISYSETYLGIVENYRLAEIVGSATAGTNGNVNPFGLPGGYSISWTGMKVLKHDGSQHHLIGIRPTVPAEPTRQGIAEGRDELLEKALEVVGP